MKNTAQANYNDGKADFAVRHLNDWTIRYTTINRKATITRQQGGHEAGKRVTATGKRILRSGAEPHG